MSTYNTTVESRRKSASNFPLRPGKFMLGASPAVPPRVCSHLTNGSDSVTSPYPRRTMSSVEPPTELNVETASEKMLNCVSGKGLSNDNGRQAIGAGSCSDVARGHHQFILGASSTKTTPVHHYPQKPGGFCCHSQQTTQPLPLHHKPRGWAAGPAAAETVDVTNPEDKPPDFVHARAIAPFQDASYRNALFFTENEVLCVFVDSMQPTTSDDGSELSHSGWWRGFRTAQGPAGPIGFFPSSHVTLLHPRAAAQLIASSTGNSGEFRKTTPVADLTSKTDRLSLHDVSSSSNSDFVGEDGDEFIDASVSVGTPEDDRCPVTNGNEAALHVEAGVLREIEALADTALKGGGVPTSCPPYTVSLTPCSAMTTHQPQQPRRMNPPAAARSGLHVPESMDSSNRNSATSLDSGRGSAYANSSDGSKTFSGMCKHFPGHQSHQPQHFHHSQQHPRTNCLMDASLPVYMGSDQRLPSPRHSAWASPASSSDVGPVFRSPAHTVPYPTGHPPNNAFRSVGIAPLWNPDGCHSCSSGSSASSCSSCGMNNNVEAYEKKDDSVELLVGWLSSAGFAEYASCIAAAGYDLCALARATPEDLNACGVTNPHHRQQLRGRLSRLQFPESIPDNVPASIIEWLSILNLVTYWPTLQSQGLTTFEQIAALSWEDLEEIGITKLGHQKKIILAIEKLRRCISKRSGESKETQHAMTLLKPVPTHSRPCPLSTVPYDESRLDSSHNGTSFKPADQSLQASEDAEVEDDDFLEAGSTPPPPPAFQDPPVDDPSAQSSPHEKNTEPTVVSVVTSVVSSGSPSTLENALFATAVAGTDLRTPPLFQRPYEAPTRQRYRSSKTLNIPVAVANKMMPPPQGLGNMDRDLQDMHDIRSMLDQLSEHLVPTKSASSN